MNKEKIFDYKEAVMKEMPTIERNGNFLSDESIKHYKQMIITLVKYGRHFQSLPNEILIDSNRVSEWIAYFNGLAGSGSYYNEKGIEIFIEEMGFKNEEHIKRFFEFNKNIWGNDNGRSLFCKDDAYCEEECTDKDWKLTPIVISNKFFAVAERLANSNYRMNL